MSSMLQRVGLGCALVLLAGVSPGGAQPAGGEFQVNTYTTSYQYDPAVAAEPAGSFVVVWTSLFQDGLSSGVFGQRYAATGAPAGGEFQVNTYTTYPQYLPAVAADPSGSFVVAWTSGYFFGTQDGSAAGVFGQRYAASGAPLGGEFLVNTYTTGGQTAPAVAADPSGSFVVVWQSLQEGGYSYGIYGQRYDSTGAAVGGEFHVNTYSTGPQRSPAVAAAASGSFVVVWHSTSQDGYGYGIFGQRYAATGAPLGGEFQVNTYTTYSQTSPAVATDASGSFLVVWESVGQDGHLSSISGQRYAATGAPVGGEFLVNTYTTNLQRSPAVATDGGGKFVVTWQSYTQDGSGYGIFGQRYAATGAPLGGEFRVNTYTTSFQRRSAVAADASGSFVVAWTSYSQDGYSSGIFAQRYAEPTTPIGFKKLLVKDNADPTKRKLVLLSKDPALDTSPPAGIDPVADSASLLVYNTAGTGDAACASLPGSAWSLAGPATGPVFKYKDAAFTSGPCKVARVKDGKLLKAVCQAKTQPIPYTLDEASQGSVGLRFKSGDTTYCAEVASPLRDTTGKFLGKDAPPPALCRAAPIGCP